MNELTPWEKRLRHWAPRRPSAKLKARLFPGTGAARRTLAQSLGWRWLAPATAALVVSLFIVAERNGPSGYLGTRTTNALLANGGLSRYWVAYQTAESHSYRNAPPEATLGWTNEAAPTSTSLPLLRTN